MKKNVLLHTTPLIYFSIAYRLLKFHLKKLILAFNYFLVSVSKSGSPTKKKFKAV